MHKDIIKTHPCFSEEAHHKFGRIHLPVASMCNIQCRYCVRKYDCANESRPGITSKVMSPVEAIEKVRVLVERNERISVIGIAGPGDPLANESTFEVLNVIKKEFPEITLCLSTNGMLLSDNLESLIDVGVESLTITINAITPETAEKIYSWVLYKGRKLTGRQAAITLLCNQWIGLRSAVKAGLIVKINSVLIPGINEAEMPLIAKLAGGMGAEIMNIMPLIPQSEYAHLQMPSFAALNKMRDDCKGYMPQMTHCRQCRADAFGAIDEDKDMELEILNSRIGDDYCENVN